MAVDNYMIHMKLWKFHFLDDWFAICMYETDFMQVTAFSYHDPLLLLPHIFEIWTRYWREINGFQNFMSWICLKKARVSRGTATTLPS